MYGAVVAPSNLWGEHYEWADFPMWRKVLIFFFFILFFSIGYRLFSKETEIYASSPAGPVTETRQVVPVHVNHGSLRYVTESDAQELSHLRATVPPVVLSLGLAAVGLLITYRNGRKK